MDRKRRGAHKSEDEVEIEADEEVHGDVIATIHVLKNKTQVKKRVVTRHAKDTEET